MPPQPSIEEARQQMHSLLDDAFALVSPSSQGSAGLSGVSPAHPSPSFLSRLVCRLAGAGWSVSWVVLNFISSCFLPPEIRRAGNVPHLHPGPSTEVSTSKLQVCSLGWGQYWHCLPLKQARPWFRRVCFYWRPDAGASLLQQGAVWGPSILLQTKTCRRQHRYSHPDHNRLTDCKTF